MEFLDPVARKKKLRRLFVGYGLLSVLILLATYVLVATALGYEIFTTKGEVVQNGLLFVDTKPVSASVTLNGRTENDRTDSKFALASGEYEVILKADGYRDWTKRVLLEGGKVRFLLYPKLFPLDIKTESIATLHAEQGLITQSPDRRWVVIQSNKAIPSLDIYDLEKDPVTSVSVVIPPTILQSRDGSFGTFVAEEWSDDNRHILVTQTMTDGKVNYLVIDRQVIDASLNLNNLFSVDPTNVTLRDKKSDKFYFYFASGGLLRAADSKARAIAEPIIDQVVDFKPYGDDIIIYATTKDATVGKLAVKVLDGGETYSLGEAVFDAAGKYYLDAAEFEGDWYFVIGSGTNDKVQVFKNPKNFAEGSEPKPPTVLSTLRPGVPAFVGFSANTRFVMAQSGKTLAVYDAEDSQSYRFDLPFELDAGSKVEWIDGHRFQATSGGRLYVIEFDGKNSTDISAIKAGTPGLFDKDYERAFTILPGTNSNDFQVSSLVVEQ